MESFVGEKCKLDVLNSLKEDFYKHILNNILGIISDRQIYKDFQKACIARKLQCDPFLDYVDRNYYEMMIIKIAKLLEPSKYKDDRNFGDFIKRFNENVDSILNSRKVPVTNIDTHEVKIFDCTDMVKKDFDAVQHSENIKKLERLHKKFKRYRDKVICHSTSFDPKESDIPTYNDIEDAVDSLNQLLNAYAGLFGIHIAGGAPFLYFNSLMSPVIS